MAPESSHGRESQEDSARGSAAGGGTAGADHARMIAAALRQVQELPTAVHGLDTTAPGGVRAPGLPLHADPDAVPGYTIEREISRGGQGVVYEAVQQSTGRRVAIKLMLAGPLASAGERARFEREVRVLGRLRHPNIVSIHHSGALPGGGYFYVMDYIAGLPLDVFVRRGARSSGRSEHPLDVPAMLRLMATVCDAIQAAHQRGIIHRDLKPGNVRVDEGGVPHVLDFGLSKLADDPDDRSATRTGQFVGSVPWASPEQAAGESDGIDVRTDVYSLGVLLFQILTDRFPYAVTGRASEVLEAIRHTPPLRPRTLRRDLSDDVETIVLMCLQKEPNRRYQSAGELAADLRRYLAGEPIEARRDSGWYVLRKHLWRHRLALGVAAAFVGLVLAFAMVAWSLYREASAARASAEERSREATERLYDSYLAQARATRVSNRIGRRFETLAVVAQAAAVRPLQHESDFELRSEVIAALGLTDLRLLHDYDVEQRASAAGLAVLDRFAEFGNDGRVRVRAAADGRVLADLAGPQVPAWLAIFSPDGRYVGVKYHEAGDAQVTFILWDTDGGRGTRAIVLGPDVGVRSYAFSEDGRTLAVVGADRVVRVFERAGAGARERERAGAGDGFRIRTTFPIHGDPYRLAIQPGIRPMGDGGALNSSGVRWPRVVAVSSLYEPYLELYDLDGGRLLHTLDSPRAIRGPAWSPDGWRLAAPADDGRVYLWRFERDDVTGELRVVPGDETDAAAASKPAAGRGGAGPYASFLTHQSEAVEAYFDPAGRFLVSWGWDNIARFWDPATGRPLLDPLEGWMVSEVRERIAVFRRPQRFSFLTYEEPVGLETLTADGERAINSCALVAGGRGVLASGAGGLWLWDRAGGKRALPRQLRAAWMGNVRALDDARVIAFDERGVWRWEVRVGDGGLAAGEGELLWPLEQIISVGVSPGGRFLAARTREALVCFDVGKRSVIRRFPLHPGMHGTPSISAEGRWMLAGTWRGDPARVYDLATGAKVLEIADHQVHGAFAEDGRMVVSVREEYTVYRSEDWAIERRIPRSPQAAVVGGCAFSRADGWTRAALTRTGYDLVLTSLESGEPIAELPNPGQALLGWMSFSTDGETLAVSSERGVLVWDLGRLRTELQPMGLDWER
ncbi:MAG: hypothetical protein AMXMBFR47_15270 [Planctomycetota bacterium]